MSNQKFEEFVSDLTRLCHEYKVILTTSDGRIIQVWDDEGAEIDDYFDFQNRLNHE